MRRDGECPPVLDCYSGPRQLGTQLSSSRSQLEIVFMESVNFPQILSSPDAEIKLKNSRFHKLNKCGWKADTVFLHTPGKITSTWKLVAVSTAHVMQCAMGSWINLRWSALLFVYDSLVPRAILSPLS